MQVKITDPASAELDKIEAYYQKAGYPKFGRRLREEIVKSSKRLSLHPKMGQEEEFLKRLGQGHRYIIVRPNYKLIYLIKDEIIYIVDVFDTRQDPSRMKNK